MLLIIIILTFCIFYVCGKKSFLVDKVEKKSVRGGCLQEGRSPEETSLHISNLCCHMVGRPSEVFLSRFDEIMMETVRNNNETDSVVVQGINHPKTRIYKEICISLSQIRFLRLPLCRHFIESGSITILLFIGNITLFYMVP